MDVGQRTYQWTVARAFAVWLNSQCWDKSCIFGIPNLDVYDLPTITIIYIVWGGGG